MLKKLQSTLIRFCCLLTFKKLKSTQHICGDINKPGTILTTIINLDADYFPFSPKNVHTTQEL